MRLQAVASLTILTSMATGAILAEGADPSVAAQAPQDMETLQSTTPEQDAVLAARRTRHRGSGRRDFVRHILSVESQHM